MLIWNQADGERMASFDLCLKDGFRRIDLQGEGQFWTPKVGQLSMPIGAFA